MENSGSVFMFNVPQASTYLNLVSGDCSGLVRIGQSLVVAKRPADEVLTDVFDSTTRQQESLANVEISSLPEHTWSGFENRGNGANQARQRLISEGISLYQSV